MEKKEGCVIDDTIIKGNSNHIWIYFAVMLNGKEISETAYLLKGTVLLQRGYR